MNQEKTRLIPVIESKVFLDHPEARFAIGNIAVGSVVINGYDSEFEGVAQLRANTYLDSGFIRSDELDDHGTELDDNDNRSAHIAMLERTAIDSMARLVGNMRLVVKDDNNPSPLPVESYYPEIFSDKPLPIGSVEVSRLIARHEDARLQNLLKWPLFIAGYKYVEHYNLGPAYGLLSPPLTRQLRMQQIPVSAVADAKYIEEINATKQPVVINLPILKRVIGLVGDQGIDVSSGGFSYTNFTEVKEDGIS